MLALSTGIHTPSVAVRAPAPAMETVEDLKTLSKKLNPILGYWNPLGLGEGGFWDQPGGFWGQGQEATIGFLRQAEICLLYTSPSPRDRQKSRMPSSA